MADKYIKCVLTVIAGALIYLCVVLTPLPAAHAQSSARPGEPTGPAQVVIVGTSGTLPVAVQHAVAVVPGSEPLRVTGSVTTERSSRVADRVVLVGWEGNSAAEKAVPQSFKPLPFSGSTALPVTQR